MKAIPNQNELINAGITSILAVKTERETAQQVIKTLESCGFDRSKIESALNELTSTGKNSNNDNKYPEEVSLKKAAAILGCSKGTVLTYKEAGLLEYRNAASPKSSRPLFRFRLESVVKLRTQYQTDRPIPHAQVRTIRRRAGLPKTGGYKHLRVT